MAKPRPMVPTKIKETCNFDLEFIYVLSGWEGSSHDSRVLNDALSRRNGLKVPLAPFRGVRYHLQDFGGHGRALENEHELFNLRHYSLRNVVEMIFELHNFLHRECRYDEFPIEPDNEYSSPPINEDEFEPIFQTQEEQREIGNQWRASITTNIWEDAMQNENNDNEAE
ncbi:hypothetical protein Dsin_015440 [Dipteronia sinensis]|uniref:DDE Tnp4 domain-containing protein n=1 Tax=Dipteronia sinensis TaxID=43782 RepID=A0AAE0ABJ2_9ROSI|nr:hypothetical protein Dsin_015440 [Dipteronia sinensis]